MDKLKMAHEYFMKHVNTEQYKHLDDEDLISWSFDYVDAMQAEADERKPKPELPSLQQTFINGVEQPRYAPACEEWQPDWNQAPEWASWWSVDENGTANFSGKKPHIEGQQWVYYSAAGEKPCHIEAPSFDYQGDWKDSLRKRPSNI